MAIGGFFVKQNSDFSLTRTWFRAKPGLVISVSRLGLSMGFGFAGSFGILVNGDW